MVQDADPHRAETPRASPRGVLAWFRANFFALDLFLLSYFAFLLVLAIRGAFAGGLFTAESLTFILPISFGYLIFQRLALRYDRGLRGRSVEEAKPPAPRWMTIAALAFFVSPLLIVPASFLELGPLMIDNELVPSVASHPDFDLAANYDPDHQTRINPTTGVPFDPHAIDPEREADQPRNLFLGPYGAATAWDITLKQADIAVFGVYPPEWVRQYHTPFLTGVMQLGYIFYYLAPPLACIPLLFRRRRRAKGERSEAETGAAEPTRLDLSEFRIATATIGACILMTYFLYFVFPSTGPRFEGGARAWMPDEPGWFGAEAIYLAIDAAETFRWNAFPSGHVAVSIICTFVALKFRRGIGLAMILPVVVLCLATVYMGYHFAIDVIGGLACAAICMAFVPRFAAWWERK